MRRFFVEEINIMPDGSCVISGAEARHILKVLRMGRGDRFILMNGAGERYAAMIESVEGSKARVKLTEKLQGPAMSKLAITLCQAVLKSGPMDYLVEKTSELGVTSIMPFTSERTVIKTDDQVISNKVRRWREIAVSAAKQSDRVRPADIAQPDTFTNILHNFKDTDHLKVILWEREDSRDLKELLKASGHGHNIVGMVGPEGGFSTGEAEAAAQSGFIPVSLGRMVLRAETAAITLVALIQYERGDLSL